MSYFFFSRSLLMGAPWSPFIPKSSPRAKRSKNPKKLHDKFLGSLWKNSQNNWRNSFEAQSQENSKTIYIRNSKQFPRRILRESPLNVYEYRFLKWCSVFDQKMRKYIQFDFKEVSKKLLEIPEKYKKDVGEVPEILAPRIKWRRFLTNYHINWRIIRGGCISNYLKNI